MGIRFTGKVKGIHIGHGAGRQYPFKLGSELVPSKGHDREEALFLPQGQHIHRQLCLCNLHGQIRFQRLQPFRTFGLQFQKHSTVEQRLPLMLQLIQQGCHIQQVLLGLHRFCDIGVAQLQTVLPVGMVDNLIMLPVIHHTVIDSHSHTAVVCQMGQDRLFLGAGGILFYRPHTAIAVTYNIVVREKLHRGGTDAVKEGLGFLRCNLLRGGRFLLKQSHLLPPFYIGLRPHPGAYLRPWWCQNRYPAAA